MALPLIFSLLLAMRSFHHRSSSLSMRLVSCLPRVINHRPPRKVICIGEPPFVAIDYALKLPLMPDHVLRLLADLTHDPSRRNVLLVTPRREASSAPRGTARSARPRTPWLKQLMHHYWAYGLVSSTGMATIAAYEWR
jgi:hypothetical protein